MIQAEVGAAADRSAEIRDKGINLYYAWLFSNLAAKFSRLNLKIPLPNIIRKKLNLKPFNINIILLGCVFFKNQNVFEA